MIYRTSNPVNLVNLVSKVKTRAIEDAMVRVLSEPGWSVCSTDIHLILSVRLINGLRHWRNEDLEAAAEARHNRGQLARRLYDLRLNEVCRECHLLLRAINRPANQFDFVTRFNRRVAHQHLQFRNLVTD